MTGNNKNQEPAPDPRLEFIKSYTEKSLRLKHEKWQKMLGNEDSLALINDFFNRPEETTLTFTLKDGGPLVPCLGYPAQAKSKLVYVTKSKPEEISDDNYRTLILGDLPPNPVDALSILTNIFAPLLSNPKNRKGWPKCVSQDVSKHVHGFKSLVMEVQGKIIGQTILPLPIGMENIFEQAQKAFDSNGRDVDLQLKSAIEGVVIKWSSLVEEAINDDVLKISPGTHPGPTAEIEFWNKRRQNLEQLYNQLMEPKVQKIAVILESTKSAYFATYEVFFAKVVNGVTEAREITAYLRSFLPIIAKYESVEFVNSLEQLKAFVNCVCVMWSRSNYYSTGSRTLYFLSLFSNSVVTLCMKYLDPGSIFQNDTEETRSSINSCLEVLSQLHSFAAKCRRDIIHFFTESGRAYKPFNFEMSTPFERMNKLVLRLTNIKDFMDASIDYLKLDRIIIGGIKGAVFCKQINAIFEEFQQEYNVFKAASYDPLEPDQQDFVIDYKQFLSKSQDFDLRLGSIFSMAYDSSSLNGICELILIIGTLANRPIIRKEIECKYERVNDRTMIELEAVRKVYEENMKTLSLTGKMPTPHHFPATAEVISWVFVLSQRVRQPMEWIKLLEPSIGGKVDLSHVKEVSEEMLLLLHKLERKAVAKFSQKAVVEAELHLQKSIMTRVSDRLLALNFDPGLVSILKEMKYLKMFGPYELPPQLNALFDRDDELFLWVQCLNGLVSCYNEIKIKSIPVEMALVEEEVLLIDDVVDLGIEVYNWTTPETEKFIMKARLLVKRLHSRVVEAQQNTREIKELMSQWKDNPLFVRSPPTQLLGLSDRLHRVATRYNEIREAGKQVHELLNINYHLLLPLPESEHEPEDKPDAEDGEDTDQAYDSERDTEGDDTDGGQTSRKILRRRRNVEEDRELEALESRIYREEDVTDPEPPASEEEDGEEFEKAKPKKKSKKKKSDKIEAVGGKTGKRKLKKKAKVVDAEKAAETSADPEREKERVGKSRDQEDRWRDYVDYIDESVATGITSAISSSVSYLMVETDAQRGTLTPLFQVELHLTDPDIVFIPHFETTEGGFLGKIKSILAEIFEVGRLVPRVAPHKNLDDYQNEAKNCENLENMKLEILARTERVMEQARDFAEQLMEYSYLWLTNQQVELEEYLKYGRALTTQDEEDIARGIRIVPENQPTLENFKEIINFYGNLNVELDEKINEAEVFDKWLLVNCRPFKQALLKVVNDWGRLYKDHLYENVLDRIAELETMTAESERILSVPVAEDDYDALVGVMDVLYQIRERTARTDEMFEPLWETIELLKNYDVEFNEDTHISLQELPEKWSNLKKQAISARQLIQPLIAIQVALVKKRMNSFDIDQAEFRLFVESCDIFRPSTDVEKIYEKINEKQAELVEMEDIQSAIAKQAALFEVTVTEKKDLAITRRNLVIVKTLWDLVDIIQSSFNQWKASSWKKVDVEFMDRECKGFAKKLRGLDKESRAWAVYRDTERVLKEMMTSLRAVTELQNPAIKSRHWKQLMIATNVDFVMNDDATLEELLKLDLHKFEEEVKTIVDKSVKEMSMEKTLKELETTWRTVEFDKIEHERTKSTVIAASEELISQLETDQNALQNMMSSKFIDHFLAQVSAWQKRLSNADVAISLWLEVQRAWQHLESIFIGSEDIRTQLPADTRRFEAIDNKFRSLLVTMVKDLNVIRATSKPGLVKTLEQLQQELVLCEKALSDYLETKRLVYPRFYFVSSADLLDILSNGNQPELVTKHLTKLYDSLSRLKFNPGTKTAVGMYAKDGEYIPFKTPCDCSGKVEVWLNRVTESMRKNLLAYFSAAVAAYEEKPRDQFLLDFPAQVALCTTQISWSAEVSMAFARLNEGSETALKDYFKKQVNQLSVLINKLAEELTRGERQKIMTVCTIDVHSRDVVGKMVAQRVDSVIAFEWQSQLRHRWDSKAKDCYANICDAQFRYDYEYLGCTPRLVITPLTDRCYITLTQSLRLIMGGAPAGPAGTGKTETTKDLGRALGYMVYVFNCSEQMDYKSCGNIYKGLAQTGAWGCFDEFNRISVEVLSVVAVQVKSVQDAIKAKRSKFNFMGETISLIPTVGIFITMNPGYAGRTELPENLKALFRPCAMVVPDFELICEIMLVAEGFQEARLLARKFITLYTLCRELLSKQDHYDWGLRAIKSVLVVAGSLKRGDRQSDEDHVLMRALRDFNIPKIVTDDLPVFLGLISDLFPAVVVPRKRNIEFENIIKQACVEKGLQPEENFILKCVQLEELFEVRHSVFIVGFAGTGKTQVWKTLMNTYTKQDKRPFYNDLNPKAVTNDELFGAINPATREWRDGLFSVIMRDQANMAGNGPKWIVLDGDIDPMWIESLNTLMDDNKVLTLASNERIALTSSMRLLFEISNLKTATPATVSRAGILYINPTDLGWNPFVTSWIDKRQSESEKVQLTILFDRYVPSCLEALKTKFKKITPLPEINHLNVLCQLLNCLLKPDNISDDSPKEWYEMYFAFACVWAFGAAMFQDQLVDWRSEFSRWFQSEFKGVQFPSGGTVFSYYIDAETKHFIPWTNIVPNFEFDPELPLQNTLVSTAETTRVRYLMDLLLEAQVPIMLVGGAGSGKSVVVSDKMTSLSEAYAVTNVPFNFYTTSEMLQKVLEKPLEKKAGRNYGPPGSKRMIYFIDDMNMPEVDSYGTVQPHTLIRQHIDYNHWYDRTKLTLKEVHNCQYVSCMNPTAGSFTIDPRLQRHFAVFAVSLPSGDALQSIYEKILTGHLTSSLHKFSSALLKTVPVLIAVALQLHQKMAQAFLPTAIKFHYTFNMRDLANICQGLLFSTPDCIPTSGSLIKLWMHEAHRVYCDKLVEEKDIKTFKGLINEFIQKGFEDLDENEVMVDPLLYCHFAEGIGESKYLPVESWANMSKLLQEALSQYNELVAAADLVLFEDAMHHVCRINRILEAPRGNALLVGVGGSGKQSLSRLAAFISTLDVFQIQLRKGYSLIDLKADVAQLYIKAGLKNSGVVFLMTDAQVAEEKFLVVINDCLASGEIPELFPDEDVDNIVSSVRNEVKGAGIVDSKENCWRFFIDKVRRLLKIVLCFSPVGSTLRVRARKFPAVVNCTAIDWFHEWPQEALVSVSRRFLANIPSLPEHLYDSVAKFMAHVHTSVNATSELYLAAERRYNYTTPKSFLEQISLYGKLLESKSDANMKEIERLENGLAKLRSTSAQVDIMKEKLKGQDAELAVKNDEADMLISVVKTDSAKVADEKAVAAKEEEKVRIIEEDVVKKQRNCEEDLKKAIPALNAAQAALDTLEKGNLTEYKSFGTPPPGADDVAAAVMVLFAHKGKIPRMQDRTWKNSKAMMGKVDQFLDQLIHYDKDNIQPEAVKAIQYYLNKPGFDPEKIKSKSSAAAGLCSWVINIIKYYEVFKEVEPKRLALEEANAELSDARGKLNALKEQLAKLELDLSILTEKFDKAMAEKKRCQDGADETKNKIDVANRLVNSLSSKSVLWRDKLASFKSIVSFLPGDILLTTAFISYLGCFTRRYRADLIDVQWKPHIKTLEPPIPMTEGADHIKLLTDGVQIAAWNNEGLPSDRMSVENATILVNSTRWPLMIDPQLQGIKWIKTKYGDELQIVRLGQKFYMEIIERAISDGGTVLIENIGESMDAVLEPLLSRALIRKGTAIKIGDKEVDFNPKFRLILHTKLANPHYQPEMQAQTTLINFTVTRDGLEEQLLGEVVKAERLDLEEKKTELTQLQNTLKIREKSLDDDLLTRLNNAGEDIVSDLALVENLEESVKTSDDIKQQASEAQATSVNIDEAREQYRPIAARASLLYFVLSDLNTINPIYQFSLKAFSVVFNKAIADTEAENNLRARVRLLLDTVTYCVFMYTTRALFEKDKIIFTAHMTIQILLAAKEIEPEELDFLLRFPANQNTPSPLEFLSSVSWGGIKALSLMLEFRGLDKDIEVSAKRWKKLVESEKPEREKLPQEWKNKTPLQKLCIMRCLRPDRMTYAVGVFIEEKLGVKYMEGRTASLSQSYKESTPATSIFFILSPGVDPSKDVELLGRQHGFTQDQRTLHNVSLGQGQEIVAEEAMDLASSRGHWVMLQNVHLVKKWLTILEKKMEQCAEGAHEDYRLFISAEPAPTPDHHIIPQGILESAIKITNEPPTGMLANLHKALDNFDQATLESSTKESEFKAILFSLCYFHAVVAERRKFGAQGWNRVYPFNVGDLRISSNVLYNYLENNSRVPWEDLRYLFGEIMYGGHITDDWDRRLCRTYLEEYMRPDLIDAELYLAPGFLAPPNSDHAGYKRYVDHQLPAESPALYGLHLNAEIGFLTALSDNLFRTLLEMQPRDAGKGTATVMSREDKVKTVLDDIMDKVPEEFNLPEMMSRVEDKTPYVLVAFQELERMNILSCEIKRSLRELDLGLKGELTISADMESLMGALFLDQVPATWAKLAYPSLLPLGGWLVDLVARLRELESWSNDFVLPPSVWLSGFFNPQSFLTAIMQSTARKNEWPLDKICLHCDVTKKSREEILSAPREGASIHGLFMEGARWDVQLGCIVESRIKELAPAMPVIFIKAITQDKQDTRMMYECPLYKTRQRGPTFVWTFNMKTREKPSKWTLAGVALLLSK